MLLTSPLQNLKGYEMKEHENIHASYQNISRTNLAGAPLLISLSITSMSSPYSTAT